MELEKRKLYNLTKRQKRLFEGKVEKVSIWEPRVDEIKSMVAAGQTQGAIGQVYGVSKERIRQVMWKYKIYTSKMAKQALRDKIAKELRKDREIRKLEKKLEKLKSLQVG